MCGLFYLLFWCAVLRFLDVTDVSEGVFTCTKAAVPSAIQKHRANANPLIRVTMFSSIKTTILAGLFYSLQLKDDLVNEIVQDL